MNRDTLIAAAHEMQRSGGGFASALAEAFFRADSTNAAKLITHWYALFEQFARLADYTDEDAAADVANEQQRERRIHACDR